jgi:hypothetical protein
VVRDGVVVLLGCDLEVLLEEDAFERFCSPTNSLTSWSRHVETTVLLSNTLINQAVNLVSISAEYIMLGAGKVRMYLARKEGVFRDISSSRVLIKREDK